MAVRCCQGDGDIELSYDPTQEPTQSDAARETGTLRFLRPSPGAEGWQSDVARETGILSCLTTQPRSRVLVGTCCLFLISWFLARVGP